MIYADLLRDYLIFNSYNIKEVSIKGDRLVIESTNFSLDKSGSASAKNFECKENLLLSCDDVKFNLISGFATESGSLVCEIGELGVEAIGIRALNTTFYGSAGVSGGDFAVFGNFSVSGTKSRLASTKNYNDRLLYCYEMPSPLFGDIGHGVIGNDGLCYVDIDSIFAETIDTIQQYYVFLQPYSDKPLYIKEKTENYFVVCGEPNTEFDWEIKAKQSDFPMERLEENSDDEFSDIDYVSSAEKYLENYEKELTV